ncbi:MAG: glycosyl hydrolase family 32 [Lentisphaeria bacterium]|nr:glycosyl hydrolase family 32 [Lentisphaeria bacterium]
MTKDNAIPSDQRGELLYNGIRLPAQWPPRAVDRSGPRPAPYLSDPPEVIPIDVGRQLFVDDFLIEASDLERTYHRPTIDARGPVFKPETKLELEGVIPSGDPAMYMRDLGLPLSADDAAMDRVPQRSVAAPNSGGVWFDPQDRLFKMWYMAGWFSAIAYATSADGIIWERPPLEFVPGTNALFEEMGHTDSTLVWLDHDAADAEERFKLSIYRKGPRRRMELCTSPDGIHWRVRSCVYYKYDPPGTVPQLQYSSLDGVSWSAEDVVSRLDDRTTFFYNPFRQKWVYSIRSGNIAAVRTRHYREHDDFVEGAKWTDDNAVYWTAADELDLPEPGIDQAAQLYNVDAVAYESVMIGLFAIFRGPDNATAFEMKEPKLNDLSIAFSRDGFHWDRPDRRHFIAGSRQPGEWNRAYIQSAGGCCLVVGDELRFYFSVFSGVCPDGRADLYAGGSTGLAVLRRDGFASMDACAGAGTLTTRPVTFGGKYLFVNADTSGGQLEVELLDREGRVIEPFTRKGCVPVAADLTRQQVTWASVQDLSAVVGQPVRFRFHLNAGRLYAFWVSPDPSGASHGYVAAGGPGFTGATDTAGAAANTDA